MVKAPPRESDVNERAVRDAHPGRHGPERSQTGCVGVGGSKRLSRKAGELNKCFMNFKQLFVCLQF